MQVLGPKYIKSYKTYIKKTKKKRVRLIKGAFLSFI